MSAARDASAKGGGRARGYLHVDLDGLWTVAAAYGWPEGDSFERDPLFEFALPRLLDLLDEFSIPATFFVVGRDLALPAKRRAVEGILARGHRLANHTHSHPLGLELLDEAAIEREIVRANDAIAEVAGKRPLGFRAPGYDAGEKVLRACAKAGIRYDGSLLPTPWAPLLRAAAGRLLNPDAPPETKRAARRMYGRRDAEAPLPASAESRVVRPPVAVSPLLRLPIHASLGVAFGGSAVARALRRLGRGDAPVVYLLHPMDAADPAEFRPALPARLAASRVFGRPLAERLAFLRDVLGAFAAATDLATTEGDAEREA